MADYTHTELQVVGRHVPDPAGGPFESMDHAKAAGHDVINPVTGLYEIGVIIEGAFYPFLIEKASLVFDRIDAAKAQAAADEAAQPRPTAPAAPQAETPAAAATAPGEGQAPGEGEAPTTGPQSGVEAPPAQPQPQG